MNESVTGGCQCGAVRYRIQGALRNPHICHCRMCQKAAGNYFMPLAGVNKPDFVVTRGEISWFYSSDPVRRGFCSQCGTPIAIDTLDDPEIHIMLGSLDKPEAFEPARQVGTEAKMPWFGNLDHTKASITEDSSTEDQRLIDEVRRTNHQHPDHDTDKWPVL